jgi:hypothetical protein
MAYHQSGDNCGYHPYDRQTHSHISGNPIVLEEEDARQCRADAAFDSPDTYCIAYLYGEGNLQHKIS